MLQKYVIDLRTYVRNTSSSTLRMCGYNNCEGTYVHNVCTYVHLSLEVGLQIYVVCISELTVVLMEPLIKPTLRRPSALYNGHFAESQIYYFQSSPSSIHQSHTHVCTCRALSPNVMRTASVNENEIFPPSTLKCRGSSEGFASQRHHLKAVTKHT